MAYTTIDDPSAYFQTVLYTGNESGQSITNDGNSDLQPDLVWIKNRGDAHGHQLQDSTRGVGKALESNNTDPEQTGTVQDNFTAFNSDGFSLGAGHQKYNDQDDTYVAWQWKCNGGTTTATSASGSTDDDTDIIATTHQANTTAGFSIITYDGDATSGKKITHGLGATPTFALFKNIEYGSGTSWGVFTTKTGVTALALDTTAAAATDSGFFSNTLPDATHITVGSHGNTGSAHDFVCYAFTNIQGYSKFGSYTGNGNDDGPFVYTGFKPAWLIYKRSSDTGNWRILDHKRDTYNVMGNEIYADLSNAEADDDQIDFLSNGFKLRNGSSVGQNGNGSTYVYMAFAKHPFVSSEGVPTTAR